MKENNLKENYLDCIRKRWFTKSNIHCLITLCIAYVKDGSSNQTYIAYVTYLWTETKK